MQRAEAYCVLSYLGLGPMYATDRRQKKKKKKYLFITNTSNFRLIASPDDRDGLPELPSVPVTHTSAVTQTDVR